MKVEGFFRTRRFIHEFSKVVLQLVFRWGDAVHEREWGLVVINIERIWVGGVVTFKWNIRNRFIGLETGGGVVSG